MDGARGCRATPTVSSSGTTGERTTPERQIGLHRNQLHVPVSSVRHLVKQQFPHWSDLPIEAVAAEGTVHAIFRIGHSLRARFRLTLEDPRAASKTLAVEAKLATELAGAITVASPLPVAIGAPGAHYPLPWSVYTWVDGATATDACPEDSVDLADDLADLIADLRSVPLKGRSFEAHGPPRRGGNLADHNRWVQECLDRSEFLLQTGALREMWQHLIRLPPHPFEVMSHGDLIPGNIVVAEGRLTGILDVGGFGAADPALDLVSAWSLLEAQPRQRLRERLAPTELEWERSKAWAFQQAIGLVWYYEVSNPVMSRLGRQMLRRLQESA